MSIADQDQDQDQDQVAKATPLISAKGIGVSYGNKVALQPLSFEVNSGEIFGLIGANGGGKTTTLRLLAGLAPASVGHLTIFERTDRAKVIGHDLGYVSQSASLYQDLTVLENLNFHASVYGVNDPIAAVESVMIRFDLKPFANTRINSLSGGWTRLAQLSASVLHEPKLLLLDEPTAGLDVAMRSKVWQHIDRMAGDGTGVVISTHDLTEALRCTHAVFLADGKKHAQGTPKQILQQADSAVYILKNNNLEGLLKLITNIAGCVECSRESDVLRVIIQKNSLNELKEICEKTGSEFKATELSLADASFAFLARGCNDV